MFGMNMGRMGAVGGVLPFTPSKLFTGTTTGAWYDPSDTTTLYRDAAGTQPVTAVEQPVGLMKDKSGRNNHAFNSSGNSANFPVLSARYNLLTKTEDFSDAVWSKAGLAPFGSGSIANAAIAPDGASTADFLCENTSLSSHGVAYNLGSVGQAGTIYKQSICIRKSGVPNGRRWAYVALLIGANALISKRYILNIDLQTGLLTDSRIGSDVSNTSYAVVSNGDYWRITCSASASSASTFYMVVGASNSATPTYNATYGDVEYTGDGTSGIYIWGADLRVANDALNQPAYQRVNTATDYDTVGFKPYLRFNGTNQWLQTNSIDFSATDKMFVSAGVRKLSDAPATELLELSVNYSTNNGTFAIFHPDVSGTSAFVGKGTLSAYYSPTLASAPSTSVLSMSLNIAGTDKQSAVIPRINGIVSQSGGVGTTLGTGNFGNYPLYIGARAGSSLWFNGRLYQLVIAGKQASAAEITSTETYINQKTGAF